MWFSVTHVEKMLQWRKETKYSYVTFFISKISHCTFKLLAPVKNEDREANVWPIYADIFTIG